MTVNIVCSECGGTMQKGYIPDYTYGGSSQSFWIEGSFEKDFLGLPKTKGRKKYYLTAYMCEQCGFLKFYAGPDSLQTNR